MMLVSRLREEAAAAEARAEEEKTLRERYVHTLIYTQTLQSTVAHTVYNIYIQYTYIYIYTIYVKYRDARINTSPAQYATHVYCVGWV